VISQYMPHVNGTKRKLFTVGGKCGDGPAHRVGTNVMHIMEPVLGLSSGVHVVMVYCVLH